MLSSLLSTYQKSQNIPFTRQDVYLADLVLLWYVIAGYQNLTPMLSLLVSMAAILTKDSKWWWKVVVCKQGSGQVLCIYEVYAKGPQWGKTRLLVGESLVVLSLLSRINNLVLLFLHLSDKFPCWQLSLFYVNQFYVAVTFYFTHTFTLCLYCYWVNLESLRCLWHISCNLCWC